MTFLQIRLPLSNLILALGILCLAVSCEPALSSEDSIAEAVEAPSTLEEAYSLLEAGESEKAKPLFEKFASEGVADAHYALAHNYLLSPEESIFHFSEAAKLGHLESIKMAMEATLIRPNDWRYVNPKMAFEIYSAAKEKGGAPANEVANYQLSIIQKCMEAPSLDVAALMEKYPFIEEHGNPYYIWTLAKEASEGGRFGAPNPTLAFQLVIRGSEVPAEFGDAVEEAYSSWKKNRGKFSFCGFVVSNMGIEYCRYLEEEEKKQELAPVLEGLNSPQQKAVVKAYDTAKTYFAKNIYNNEQSESTNAGALEEKLATSLSDYREMILQVKNGTFTSFSLPTLAAADEELNNFYQQVMAELEDTNTAQIIGMDQSKLKFIQRSWIPYRDATVALFKTLAPEVDANTWMAWLTQNRSADLEFLLKDIENNRFFNSGD